MNSHRVVKASHVHGAKVKNEFNEQLGQIIELVINKNLGQVYYAVLDLDGIIGLENKYCAIPWSAFIYNGVEDCFILYVDKEHLKRAPGFDKDNWPNFADPIYLTTLKEFYK